MQLACSSSGMRFQTRGLCESPGWRDVIHAPRLAFRGALSDHELDFRLRFCDSVLKRLLVRFNFSLQNPVLR